jgi:hypothetical protein
VETVLRELLLLLKDSRRLWNAWNTSFLSSAFIKAGCKMQLRSMSPNAMRSAKAWITSRTTDRKWHWQAPPVASPTGRFANVQEALYEFNAIRDRRSRRA